MDKILTNSCALFSAFWADNEKNKKIKKRRCML